MKVASAPVFGWTTKDLAVSSLEATVPWEGLQAGAFLALGGLVSVVVVVVVVAEPAEVVVAAAWSFEAGALVSAASDRAAVPTIKARVRMHTDVLRMVALL